MQCADMGMRKAQLGAALEAALGQRCSKAAVEAERQLGTTRTARKRGRRRRRGWGRCKRRAEAGGVHQGARLATMTAPICPRPSNQLWESSRGLFSGSAFDAADAAALCNSTCLESGVQLLLAGTRRCPRPLPRRFVPHPGAAGARQAGTGSCKCLPTFNHLHRMTINSSSSSLNPGRP